MGLQTAEGAKQHEKTLSISPSGSYSKVRHQHHVRPLKAAHWRDICRFHILAKCLADEIILFDEQGRQSAKALENGEAMDICLKLPISDSLAHQTPPQPVDKKTLSGIDEKALYLAMTRVEKNSAQAHKLDTEARFIPCPNFNWHIPGKVSREIKDSSTRNPVLRMECAIPIRFLASAECPDLKQNKDN